MRKVIIYKETWDNKKEAAATAIFHQFGITCGHYETGIGQFTTAIVEYEDGQLESVPVELIRFVEPTKEKSQCKN